MQWVHFDLNINAILSSLDFDEIKSSYFLIKHIVMIKNKKMKIYFQNNLPDGSCSINACKNFIHSISFFLSILSDNKQPSSLER